VLRDIKYAQLGVVIEFNNLKKNFYQKKKRKKPQFPYFLFSLSKILVVTAALVPDVLERGGNVDLLGAFHHPVEDHVDEYVCP
jgi:hypothetical protein